MKFDRESMLLYAVTDRTWLNGRTLPELVEQAILGGTTFVQLREKNVTDTEFLSIAEQVKKVTDQYHVPFIINDNIEVALKADADGVHVGQKDMEAGNVRKLIGKDKILGVSAQTVEQALAAERSGADYLGVGAVFSTATKQDAQNVGISVLKEICRAVSIPVVAIGGINAYNIKELKGSGIAGAAVVSALFAQNDIKAAAENLSFLLREAAAQK